MFLVDDILNQLLSFIKDNIVKNKERKFEALAHARKAMRKLASSLAEIIAFLESGVHQLERVKYDKKQFFSKLAQLVDSETLYHNCHESGVCEDLRVAQDELVQLNDTFKGKERRWVEQLIHDIDGYERMFVEATREFLAQSKEFDLLGVNTNTKADPESVLPVLEERVKSMNKIYVNIEKLLESMRNQAVPI